eukprot:TRINITY_DN106328_c0_g1_i1.p1 TRINITY_DN106328_c0_g1~~TRINITY_DN106328_c0_g1_i1.p1  ORF type:complete len:301 (+),score=41.21 TRINITY_DN106328_c0_g1_i1:96-905(+)
MDYAWSDLMATKQLLLNFSKDNKSLARNLPYFAHLDQQERELLRESLKTNTQLAVQIQAGLTKLFVAYKGKEEYEDIGREFRKECKILEELTGKILYKEKEALLRCKSSQEFRKINAKAVPEMSPLLLEMRSETESEADYRSSGGFDEAEGEEQKGSAMQLDEGKTAVEEADNSIKRVNQMHEELKLTIEEQNASLYNENEYEDKIRNKWKSRDTHSGNRTRYQMDTKTQKQTDSIRNICGFLVGHDVYNAVLYTNQLNLCFIAKITQM